MNAKTMTGLAVALSACMLQAKTVYVNCNYADYAGHDGSTPEKAVETIMDGINAASGGDTVEVAEGVYNKGSVNPSGWWGATRVSISCKKIHLKASGRREYTVIEGAHDPDTSDGIGPNAVRCIVVQDAAAADNKGGASVIEGFTIRNGAAQSNSDVPGWCGGVLSIDYSNSPIYPTLVDCTISNCTARYAAISRGGRFVRCQLVDNVIQTSYVRSDFSWYGEFVNSVFVGNRANSSAVNPSSVNYSVKLVNCSLIDNAITLYPVTATIANCLFSSTPLNAETSPATACYTENLAQPVLRHIPGRNGDARILKGRETAIQVGDASHLSALTLPSDVSAFVDFYGQAIADSGVIAAGCSQGVGPGSVEPVWYCAPDGDDSAAGDTADAPKTLQGALAVAASGDRVVALPGSYETGSMIQPGEGRTLRSRAVVPSGVTLESRDGRDTTVIKGEAGAEDQGEAGQKLGTGAMRCVYLVGAARVKGFSLSDGHTFGSVPGGGDVQSSPETTGGGVNGSELYSGWAEDCVIENCSAFRGGGARGISVRNCIFRNNLGRYIGGATSDCRCYGSLAYGNLVDDTLYGGAYSKGFAWSDRIEGCTTLDGATMCGASCVLRNTLVLGFYDCSQPAAANVQNCAFNRYKAASWSQSWEDGLIDSIIIEPNQLVVDANYVPVIGSNVCVDAGSASVATVSSERDVNGGQRVSNGVLDIGALEANWCDRYTQDLNPKRYLVATEASPSVCESASRTVLVPDGATFSALTQASGAARPYELVVKVPTGGRLTFSLDGKETVLESDGSFRFELLPDERLLTVSYSGDGSAELCRVRGASGSLLIVR